MKRRTFGSSFEFNFDGLTDAVTNLVGTLILLVLLVVLLTKESTLSSTGGTARQQELTATDEALLKLNRLSVQVQIEKQAVSRITDDIAELEKELKKLEESYPREA